MAKATPTREVVNGTRVGEVLAGKLRVERVLGEGGMGIVVAARHLHLDQSVAVKLVRPERADSRKVAQRFVREARAAVRLNSAHITQVLDAGELDDGAPYIVMELLDGQSLAELLAARGRLASDEAVALILQACVGVAEAHAHGIVHRDLKPANLFVVTEQGKPHVKVLDFGVSKAPPDADWDLDTTIEGTTLGSPAYMSPEQMRSPHNVDARTDVWALGVTLFHLLAGEPPFSAESLPDLCVKILHDPTPSLPDELDVPDGLRAVIERCLAKERDERYATVAELAAELSVFAPPAHDAVVALVPAAPRVATAAPKTTRAGASDAHHRPAASMPTTLAESSVLPAVPHEPSPAPRRSRRALWLGVAAIAVAGAAAVGLATRGEQAATPASQLEQPARTEAEPPTSAPPPVAAAADEPPPAETQATAGLEPAPRVVADAPATPSKDAKDTDATDTATAHARPARAKPIDREPPRKRSSQPRAADGEQRRAAEPNAAPNTRRPSGEPPYASQTATPVAVPAVDPPTVEPVDPADRRR